MFQFIQELLSFTHHSVVQNPAPEGRSLRIESLESRAMLSGISIATPTNLTIYEGVQGSDVSAMRVSLSEVPGSSRIISFQFETDASEAEYDVSFSNNVEIRYQSSMRNQLTGVSTVYMTATVPANCQNFDAIVTANNNDERNPDHFIHGMEDYVDLR